MSRSSETASASLRHVEVVTPERAELATSANEAGATRRPQIGSLRHQARVVAVISSSEYKLKYAESALGYVWSLLKPLGLFGMLYVVFGRFFKLNAGVPHYPLYLLLGIVLWTYFADATTIGMQSIVARSTLISKLAFPRVIIPLSVAVSSAITLGVNLVAFAVLIAASRIVPGPKWLLLLPLLLELVVLAFGLALGFSALFVRFRDFGQVWEVALQILFYASPIIYPATLLPPWFREITYLNPFVQIAQDMRAIVVPSAGSLTAAHVYGTAFGELLPVGVVLLLLAGGYALFRHEEPWFAERA